MIICDHPFVLLLVVLVCLVVDAEREQLANTVVKNANKLNTANLLRNQPENTNALRKNNVVKNIQKTRIYMIIIYYYIIYLIHKD